MSPAMDKIKDTLHLSNDHSRTHTPSNNLYPEANQTKNPPKDQGLEHIGTGTNVDHGYSTETRGNSGEGPGFVDKVKDALHLNKDKNNQNNPNTSHNKTHSEYIPNNQSESSAYIANSARRQDHGEAGAHRSTSYIPSGNDSRHTSHVPTEPSMGYYTTQTNLRNSSDHHSPQSDPRSHRIQNTGPYGSVHDSSARNTSAVPAETAQRNVGPHKSDLANRLDPRVDSNLDNSTTIGGNNTWS